jgi:hypothetical protein
MYDAVSTADLIYTEFNLLEDAFTTFFQLTYICYTPFNGRIVASERMWNEAVVAYFKAQYQHLLSEIEENHEVPQTE